MLGSSVGSGVAVWSDGGDEVACRPLLGCLGGAGWSVMIGDSSSVRSPRCRSPARREGQVSSMSMTERTAHDAGVTACPFVAFVDDRDERADVPDHRHRCYAEIRPAPRAIAHQQTYCLSSAFAACPTFQDWARREAARARGSNGGPAPDHAEIVDLDPVPIVAATASDDRGDGLPDPEPEDVPFDDRAERNPHRDWADPPPWSDPDAAATSVPADAPPFLATRPPGPQRRRGGRGRGAVGLALDPGRADAADPGWGGRSRQGSETTSSSAPWPRTGRTGSDRPHSPAPARPHRAAVPLDGPSRRPPRRRFPRPVARRPAATWRVRPGSGRAGSRRTRP